MWEAQLGSSGQGRRVLTAEEWPEERAYAEELARVAAELAFSIR